MIQTLIAIGVGTAYFFVGFIITRLLEEYLYGNFAAELGDGLIFILAMIFFPVVLVALVLRWLGNLIVDGILYIF